MTVRRSVLSDEYVRVSVRALEGGELIDVTGDTVEIAIVLAGTDPADDDWSAGTWETPAASPTAYYARALQSDVMGADPPYEPGRYKVWSRVADNPEVAAEPVYTLILF